jgi:hypothetical protein
MHGLVSPGEPWFDPSGQRIIDELRLDLHKFQRDTGTLLTKSVSPDEIGRQDYMRLAHSRMDV